LKEVIEDRERRLKELNYVERTLEVYD